MYIYIYISETDSRIEKRGMGVGEGSVCASVQNMGWGGVGGGYNSQAESDSLF